MSDHRGDYLRILVALLDQANRSDVYAKRWSVSLTAVFLALATQQQGIRVAYIAVFPIVMLWFLDAQNYRKEVLLKALYDRARTMPEADIDFTIDIEGVPEAKRPTYRYLFHPSALVFYGSMLLGVVVVDCLIF